MDFDLILQYAEEQVKAAVFDPEGKDVRYWTGFRDAVREIVKRLEELQ